MKLVLLPLTVACSFACLARTWSVAELPPGGFADSEASTNITVVIPADKNRLTLSLTVDCTPSNSVEVAIGRDADGDGDLAPDEADYVLGYDCGEWFVRREEGTGNREEGTGNREEGTGIGDQGVDGGLNAGRMTRDFRLVREDIDFGWNLVKVVRRGLGPSVEFASVSANKQGLAVIVR